MRTSPLHPRFGVAIGDVDLRAVADGDGFEAVRAAFEEHSLLLFRDQQIDPPTHRRLCARFGPLEDRSQGRAEPDPLRLGGVTNLTADGRIAGEDELRTLNLKANMLWHTDSTFLPVPALINMIVARVVPSRGGATEFASTRAAFEDFDPGLQQRLQHTYLWHRYAHSRAQISEELARQSLFTMWPDRRWRAVWRNPVNGRRALYIASHAFAVEGMEPEAGRAFIADLLERATAPEYVYSHLWRPGDVLVWDERALLHRGTPWPYEEERSLDSFCVTAQDSDGLASVREGADTG